VVEPSPSATSAPTDVRRRAAETVRDLAWCVGPLVAVAVGSWLLVDLPASYGAVVGGLYLAMGVMLALGARSLPFPALGAPNRVTLSRAILVLPVAGLALPPVWGQGISLAGYWWIACLSAVALALDGLDGRLARSRGRASALGARFDMELDAFLLLALSVLLYQGGKVGAWVIAIGALRYVFVLAGVIVPALRSELPESWRRKTVCVVQGVVLVASLAPIIPSATAAWAAAGALILLVYSFAVDVRWLVSRRS